MSTQTSSRMDKAVELGGSRWTSRDGQITRVYMNVAAWAPLAGLDVDFYKSGNVRSAAFQGEGLSNGVTTALVSSKLFVDEAGVHFQYQGKRSEIAAAIVTAITTAVEA